MAAGVYPVLAEVGLSWGSATTEAHDSSCPLREFVPILRTPGIAFHGLQSQPGCSDLEQLSAGVTVPQSPADPSDIAGRARIIDQLDLVIGVDGPAIHLAGAMGKPAWVLLTYVPEWRWPLTGENTPWYPTRGSFRQTQSGDWSGDGARRRRASNKGSGNPRSSHRE